jgi:branched-chain amino acid transport system substrate-binding protein
MFGHASIKSSDVREVFRELYSGKLLRAGLRQIRCILVLAALGISAAATPAFTQLARAAEPIKIGFSMALTGVIAGNGNSAAVAMEMWRDDVNAKGGLLGRPVKLIYYDDQSNPALVPGIYSKLLNVDKVDLVVGAAGTGVISAAMPIIMQHKKAFITFFGTAVNDHFNYDKYFQVMPNGPNASLGPSEGFFQAVETMNPKPKTVALVSLDNESAHNMILGARENAKKAGLTIVFERSYPASQMEFGSIVRSIQAANPDVVFLASYPPDTVGFIRSVYEVGLKTQVFGGSMVGPQLAAIKAQLGPLLNDVLCYEFYVPEPTTNFPGVKEFLERYQQQAKKTGVEPLGFYMPPFTYAGMQILGQAVEATKSLDDNAISQYIHKTTFKTVVGDVSFAPNGEWAQSRVLYVQYRNLDSSGVEQFKLPGKQIIVAPKELASGKLHYPFSTTGK